MRQICRKTWIRGFIAVAAVLVLGAAAGTGFAAGPAFMPGFPLRAGSNVMLMWMPFPGAANYNVYRSEKQGGPYEKIGNVPANTHMDPNVPMNKTYYYVVKPVIGGKEGEASTEVVMKGLEPMLPPRMGGFLITADNKIAVRWDANPKAAFYNVFRSDSEKGDYALLTSIQDTKYTDSNVAVGKVYFYKVTSVSAANVESDKSEAMLVKLEKKVEEKAIETVKRPVTYVGYFDVDEQVALRTPKDIDADASGNFYVNHGQGTVLVVNKDLKFVKHLAKKPDDFNGVWGVQSGVFFDKKAKELYVTYSNTGFVRAFDLEGSLLRSYEIRKPEPKDAPNLGFDPAAVDCALGLDGTLWVIDGGYYQLLGLNAKGETVKRIGLPREHPDRKKHPELPNLVTPGFVAVNPKNGNVYVLEMLPQRVSVFDKDGKFIGRIGVRGQGPGGFLLPAGLATDETGRIYVGDRNLERVQVFDENGKYLALLIDPRKKDPEAQPRIAEAATGIAVQGKRLYSSNILKERVVIYTLPD